MNKAARRTLENIIRKSKTGTSNARDYENDVHQFLCDLFPFSVLPSVRLFSPSLNNNRDFGFEMDNLLHLEHDGTDYIVVIEVKNQTVHVNNGNWTCTYTAPRTGDDKKKDVTEQLNNHISTLREYLSPIAGGIKLEYLGIVVSSDARTKFKQAKGRRNTRLLLCSHEELSGLLSREFNYFGEHDRDPAHIYRVNQSDFLSLLRLGQGVPALGHPELPNAIRYVERCRRELDNRIFAHFQPTERMWAINGSAGMGKSVLLAYTACVLACGHELAVDSSADSLEEKIYPIKAGKTLEKMGFAPLSRRQNTTAQDEGSTTEAINLREGRIGVIAMSEKQLQNLQIWYDYFVDLFNRTNQGLEILFHNPVFFQANLKEDLTKQQWSALLVDEAHDLKSLTEQTISKEFQEKDFYLCVACDRHQKLQHLSKDAKLIDGLNFSRHTKRLNQIYRNPTSVYIASLGLMFRWFGGGIKDSPKVIPTKDQLKEHFGFSVEGYVETGIEVTMMSDAHPANAWSHTVASFPDVNTAYTSIEKNHIRPSDALWVRFSQEDKSFDYEQLQRHFTYHNCRTHEADDLADKYIKGQDYHVVVIEGFPSFMDDWSDEEKEKRMWKFRRELYLCASRATTFLYFICNNPDTPEGLRIRDEIESLVNACSQPINLDSGGVKRWQFHVYKTKERRPIDVFMDAELGEASAHKPADTAKTIDQPVADPSPAVPVPASPTEPVETEKPVETDEPFTQEVSDNNTEELDHGCGYTMEVYEKMTVEDFAYEMQVEPKELIRILSSDYQMKASESSLLEIPMMQRISREKYDCFIYDRSEPEPGSIEHQKAEALDLISQITKRETQEKLPEPPTHAESCLQGVVDHINLKKNFVCVKYDPYNFIPIYLDLWPEAKSLDRGDCVNLFTRDSGDEHLHLESWEKSTPHHIEDLYMHFIGTLDLSPKGDLGFINPDNENVVFVPPHYVRELTNNQLVNCWAIRNSERDHDGLKNWVITIINDNKYSSKLPSLDLPSPISPPNKTTDFEQEEHIENTPPTTDKTITLTPPVIVADLAEKMSLKPFQLMADLIKFEVFVAPHQAIELDIAEQLCLMHGYTVEKSNE